MKILIAEDHALVREGLRHILARLADDVLVMEARDFARVLLVVAEHSDLDLVLLDANLPGSKELSYLSNLRARFPSLPVMVLSASDDRNQIIAALQRDVSGVLPKSSSSDVILSALRLVLSGGTYIPSEILASIHLRPSHSPGVRRTARGYAPSGSIILANLGLTDRQIEVVELLAQGKPNKDISRELGISEGTVKIHVTAILKALNVSTRTQAVIAFTQLGMLPKKPGRSLPHTERRTGDRRRSVV